MFPRAIETPDWNHTMGTALRRALCSFSWSPLFLNRLKAILRFTREKDDGIAEALSQQGLKALDNLITKGPFPYVAN